MSAPCAIATPGRLQMRRDATGASYWPDRTADFDATGVDRQRHRSLRRLRNMDDERRGVTDLGAGAA